MSRAQLSQLIDLDEADLRQVLDYASTLSKQEAAEHFKNLLGDSPQAVEFISAFNSRRHDPTASAAGASASASTTAASATYAQTPGHGGMPQAQRGSRKKKKPALHTPPPRQVVDVGLAPGSVYNKQAAGDEYIRSTAALTSPSSSSSLAHDGAPAVKSPAGSAPAAETATVSSKPPPSAAGSLISDKLRAPGARQKPKSASRFATPGLSTSGGSVAKVSIVGGTPMHGASAAITDLDAAIRSLEISTNPTMSDRGDAASRRCNCVATRHPLQTAAPNCLHCGKVICVKEGLGPCSFCGTPLLSPDEVQAMIKELRAERGRERMTADRQAHRRVEVAGTPRPFANPRTELQANLGAAEAKAREHRDRLLGFQAQNARRTTVRDEVADFDVSGAVAGGFGGSMWASPEERARELKKQQKLLREMEWHARPDFEKRKQVLSIDVIGGKVVKKMVAVERPPTPGEEGDQKDVATTALQDHNANKGVGGGVFSRNPLLGAMIKPVYGAQGTESGNRRDRTTQWRRVQDDLDDNEGVILDGGIFGARSSVEESSRD